MSSPEATARNDVRPTYCCSSRIDFSTGRCSYDIAYALSMYKSLETVSVRGSNLRENKTGRQLGDHVTETLDGLHPVDEGTGTSMDDDAPTMDRYSEPAAAPVSSRSVSISPS